MSDNESHEKLELTGVWETYHCFRFCNLHSAHILNKHLVATVCAYTVRNLQMILFPKEMSFISIWMCFTYSLFFTSSGYTATENVNITFCTKLNENRKLELCEVLKTQLEVSCVAIEHERETTIEGTSTI